MPILWDAELRIVLDGNESASSRHVVQRRHPLSLDARSLGSKTGDIKSMNMKKEKDWEFKRDSTRVVSMLVSRRQVDRSTIPRTFKPMFQKYGSDPRTTNA